MSKTCPTCGAQIATDPRAGLLAHLQQKVKQASLLVEDSERSKPEYPFTLLTGRIRMRDKYQGWLDLIEAKE